MPIYWINLRPWKLYFVLEKSLNFVSLKLYKPWWQYSHSNCVTKKQTCRPVNILTVVSLQTKHSQVRVAMYCLCDLFYISLSTLYVSLYSRMDKAFGERIDGTGMHAFSSLQCKDIWWDVRVVLSGKVKSGVTVAKYSLVATFWLFWNEWS